MSGQQCGTCRHFEWFINPETGRKLRSQPGKCGWQFPFAWPTSWPKPYWNWQTGDYPQEPKPAMLMWSYFGADCRCYEPQPPKRGRRKRVEDGPSLLPNLER